METRIKKMSEAIEFHQMAIDRGSKFIELIIKTDSDFMKLSEKLYEQQISICFYPHILSFGIYKYSDNKKEDFFKIDENCELIWVDDKSIENIKDIATETLSVISKFY